MIIADDIGLCGRMGNVLFKYAAMKALAQHCNTEAKLSPSVLHNTTHGQECCLKYFKFKCNTYTPEEVRLIRYHYMEPRWLTFYPNFFNTPNNSNITGYFQSENYFANVKDDIKDEFELRDDIQRTVDLKMESIRNRYPGKTIIGIHMRRGDDNELNHRIYAPDTLVAGSWLHNFLLLSFNQFSDIKDKVFLVFTGGSRDNDNRKDVEWCNANLKQFNIDFQVCESNDYIIDFGMLRDCDHIILNSISTFGWWAGYLNKNPYKRIVVPGYIPEPQVTQLYDMKTYWCKDFIKV